MILWGDILIIVTFDLSSVIFRNSSIDCCWISIVSAVVTHPLHAKQSLRVILAVFFTLSFFISDETGLASSRVKSIASACDNEILTFVFLSFLSLLSLFSLIFSLSFLIWSSNGFMPI